MADLFDRDTIEALLRDLGQRLADRGVEGRLFVVGGAAIALAYGRRRVTRAQGGRQTGCEDSKSQILLHAFNKNGVRL